MNEKVLLEARKLTADFLKRRRKVLGLSQLELAEKCGMKQSAIARMEAGKFFLSTKQLWILCNALNLYSFLVAKESKSEIANIMKYRIICDKPPSKN